MNKPSGGPAFPVVQTIQTNPGDYGFAPPPQEGMTLRDYFAGQALAGNCGFPTGPEGVQASDLAVEAYRIADAMLEAREK